MHITLVIYPQSFRSVHHCATHSYVNYHLHWSITASLIYIHNHFHQSFTMHHTYISTIIYTCPSLRITLTYPQSFTPVHHSASHVYIHNHLHQSFTMHHTLISTIIYTSPSLCITLISTIIYTSLASHLQLQSFTLIHHCITFVYLSFFLLLCLFGCCLFVCCCFFLIDVKLKMTIKDHKMNLG